MSSTAERLAPWWSAIMNNRDSFLFWSFPLGTWFATQVRVSVYFPLVILALCWRLGDWELGLTFSAILFLSVLLHEIGHVLAARKTGGSASEIVLWPLGGLAMVQPASTFSSQFLTVLAGPLFNLGLCLLTLWPVLQSNAVGAAFNPLVLPISHISERWGEDLLLLIFAANWGLLLVNLIPAPPLDGGRMLRTSLARHYGGSTAAEVSIKIGFAIAVVLLIAGALATTSAWLLLIGTVVLVACLQEQLQMQMGELYDDSFMGYDFSQGYTSLERGEERVRERRPGPLKRWREKRKAEREQRLREQALEAEQQLDALLEKVHLHGMSSLTDAEKRMLQRASDRYRQKERPGEL